MLGSKFHTDFAKNVLTIFSGSVLAQAIPFFIEPFLTRLYKPAEFATLAIYISISTLFTIIATGRYELAIVLPKTDRLSINVFGLSVFITIAIGLLSGITALLGGPSLAQSFKNPSVQPYLFFLPITVLATGFYQSLNNWSLRKKRFMAVSTSRMTQTITNSGISIGFGLLGAGSIGLISAYLLGQASSLIPLLRKFIRNDLKLMKLISKKQLVNVSKTYIDFPKINSLHAFSDVLQQSLVIFLIAYYFTQDQLGYYSRTFRLVAAPASLLGSSIGQIFYQKAAQKFANNQEIHTLTKKTMIAAACISFIGFGLLMLFGEDIFAVLFGESWRQAGGYAILLSPWMMFNFIINPVSTIPIIVGRQKQVFLISIIGNSIILLSIIYGGTIYKDLASGLKILSAAMMVYYSFLIYWYLKISKTSQTSH
jgi:O-antigen/teichoic acid export membrane protein